MNKVKSTNIKRLIKQYNKNQINSKKIIDNIKECIPDTVRYIAFYESENKVVITDVNTGKLIALSHEDYLLIKPILKFFLDCEFMELDKFKKPKTNIILFRDGVKGTVLKENKEYSIVELPDGQVCNVPLYCQYTHYDKIVAYTWNNLPDLCNRREIEMEIITDDLLATFNDLPTSDSIKDNINNQVLTATGKNNEDLISELRFNLRKSYQLDFQIWRDNNNENYRYIIKNKFINSIIGVIYRDVESKNPGFNWLAYCQHVKEPLGLFPSHIIAAAAVNSCYDKIIPYHNYHEQYQNQSI